MNNIWIEPKNITNVVYQEFPNLYYYITYPEIREKLYAINKFGEVISFYQNRFIKRKIDVKRGYATVALRNIHNTTKSYIISRLVAWEFVGQPEDYKQLEVNHVNGDHFNNYYKNLEWVTTEENGIHKAVYKIAASEERHGWRTHSVEAVKYVIQLMNLGYPAPLIAKMTIKKFPKQYSSKTKYDYDRIRGFVSKINRRTSWYNTKDEMLGSTTTENIIYEKHIGDKVSRVGLTPIPARIDGHIIFESGKII